MRRIRVAAAAGAAILAACVTAACSSGSSDPSGSGTAASGKSLTTITLGIGGVSAASWASALVGYSPNICASYGITIKAEQVSSQSADAAMESDAVNFLASGGNVFLQLAQGKISNESVIAEVGYVPSEVTGIYAVPSITAPSQLVGKTFGASGPSSPTHLVAVALLKHAGISESQVNFTYFTSTPAMQAALANNAVTATWQAGPLPAANAKDHLVIGQGTDPDLQYADSYWLMGNKSFMSAHPAATVALLKCYASTIKSARTSDSATLATMQNVEGTYLGTKTEAAMLWPEYPVTGAVLPVTGATLTALEQDIDLQLGTTIPAATVAGIVDTSYMSQAVTLPVENYTGASPNGAPYSGK